MKVKEGTEEKLKNIMRTVLDCNSNLDKELYLNRLRLLYSTILDELCEDESKYNIDDIVHQICEFEICQLYLTEININQYANITKDTALEVFSVVAYSLAVEHLKGKNYFELADMMLIVFEALVASLGDSQNKMKVSESLLDFVFASGESEIMSLRLKRQWDCMR